MIKNVDLIQMKIIMWMINLLRILMKKRKNVFLIGLMKILVLEEQNYQM